LSCDLHQGAEKEGKENKGGKEMRIYIDLLFLAAITIYIVDLSGFTEEWRGALTRRIGAKQLRPIKPFDCGQCMTWWVGIIYSLCVGEFSLPILAYIAALSFLSFPIGQMMIFIREGMLSLVNKMMKLYD
jgi:hypothetical protein